jgi:23S rRNA (guanosine2251-2'-O)-methyltransferase
MLVYGKNVAIELLKKKKKIDKIILQQGFHDNNIKALLENTKIRIEYADKIKLDQLAEGNHQGIILYIPDYDYQKLTTVFDEDIIVILDHLEDPHNLGAIIRTCEAAGISGIIIPKDRSVSVNSTVMKTSAGTINNVNIVQVTNINQTIKELKDHGFWIVGTDMEGTNYREIDYSSKIVLVIGNEGLGMSRLTREACDFIATIPMYGQVNSLNASVAAGIMIYEVLRSKR